jgi:hypothetical protein
MGSPSEDFDRILTAADSVTIQLARDILAAAGIPSLAHGPDFDVAELGRAAHDVMRRQDLYVPRGAGERSLDLLEEAWGERPSTDPES